MNTDLQILDYSKEQAAIDLLVKNVFSYVEGLVIKSDDDVRKAGQWRTRQIKGIQEIIDGIFDDPIDDNDKIRRLLIKQKKHLVESKLSLASPVKKLDDDLKDKIETYLLEKQLEEDRRKKLLPVGGIDESILWSRMRSAAEKGHDDQVSEILELIDAHERGELMPEEIEMGNKKGNKPVEGLATRTHWVWELKDLDKVKKMYLNIAVKRAPVNRLVTEYHEKAEEIVGGIEVRKVTSSTRGRS